jgi:hypothetical protein
MIENPVCICPQKVPKRWFPVFCMVLALSFAMLAIFPSRAADWNLEDAIRSAVPGRFHMVMDYLRELDHDNLEYRPNLELPLFELSLSRKDIATLLELHRRNENSTERGGPAFYKSHNKWRRSTLRYNGQKYRIKVKSHSRDPDGHRKGKFISLGVKLRDGKQIHKTKRFNLIIRERLSFWNTSYLEFAQRFGLLKQRIKLVRVKINDWEEKLYYFERRLNDQEMEATGNSSLRRFRHEEDHESDKSLIFTFNEDEIPFSESKFRKIFGEVLAATEYPVGHKSAYFNRYVAFNNTIASGNARSIASFVDMDYITSFLAAVSLGGLSGHVFLKPNFYVFHNNADGKFYPVLTRDIGQAVSRPGPNQTLEQLINRPGQTYENSNPLARVPFLIALSKNDEIRQEKYRKMNHFLENFGEETIASQYRSWKSFERTHILGIAKLIAHNLGLMPYKDRTGVQFGIVRDYLRRSRPEIEVDASGKSFSLRLTPRSMSALKFNQLVLEPATSLYPGQVRVQVTSHVKGEAQKPVAHFNGKIHYSPDGIDLSDLVKSLRFSTALGTDSKAVERNYLIHFQFDSPIAAERSTPKINFSLTNAVTGEKIAAAYITVKDLDPLQKETATIDLALPYPPDSLDHWQERHPGFPISREGLNSIRLRSGSYSVHDDLVFPAGINLIIEAGTTLRVGAGKLVLVQNGLTVEGTETNPVVVTSMEASAPFGSLAVLGSQGSRSSISHLKLSNGSERWHDGAFFSGGLSIHNNDHVEIENSHFYGNRADDGVNIKNSYVVIRNAYFIDNVADQIDLDYCRGIVTDSQFITTKSENSNGDGVDVSGGDILVVQSLFSGMRDKGMSIGEESRIFLSNNRFINNNNGVAVKDLSQAYFFQNRFQNNVLDINIYQKKRIFGGGRAFVIGKAAKDFQALETKMDKKSRLRHLANSSVPTATPTDFSPEAIVTFLNQLQDSIPGDELFPKVNTELMPEDRNKITSKNPADLALSN